GRFAEEIVPVKIAGRRETVTVSADEHPRPETTLDTLAGLPALFGPSSSVTAGNASGVNDGAAALIVASEAAAREFDLKPRAGGAGAAPAGVPPRIMGIGPAPASRKVLELTRIALGDIDVVELNEAFAAQSLAVLRQLGLADDAEQV